MRRTITGFSNPTVKFLRSLREKKLRKREGKFLAEGLRLLTDAREVGRLPEVLVMATTRDAHPLLAALEADVLAAGGEVLEMDEALLGKISGKDNPQAVCGMFAEWDTSPLTRSTAMPRRSGWWRRTCAIRAISAPCCAPAMRSARAG